MQCTCPWKSPHCSDHWSCSCLYAILDINVGWSEVPRSPLISNSSFPCTVCYLFNLVLWIERQTRCCYSGGKLGNLIKMSRTSSGRHCFTCVFTYPPGASQSHPWCAVMSESCLREVLADLDFNMPLWATKFQRPCLFLCRVVLLIHIKSHFCCQNTYHVFSGTI